MKKKAKKSKKVLIYFGILLIYTNFAARIANFKK